MQSYSLSERPTGLDIIPIELNFMRRGTLKNGKLHTKDILKHTQRICNRIHHNLLEIKNLSADLLHLYKVLRYEDLVLDLENTTRNLFKFAKIPNEDGNLRLDQDKHKS